MSFRAGNQGAKMWPEAWKHGVAAITYYPLATVDLAQHAENEPRALWSELKPAQKASLKRLAYQMAAGDVIYVKEGPRIIGKGIVSGPYAFDAAFRIVDPNGVPWSHQVPVRWMPDFPEIDILLGAEQFTIFPLTQENVARIEALVLVETAALAAKAAVEGEQHKSESVFRSRNRALILAKKAASNYRCEACDMSFVEVYGRLGDRYIIAHHIEPISGGTRTTTLEEIALVCANCHAMLHAAVPPLAISSLRDVIQRHQ